MESYKNRPLGGAVKQLRLQAIPAALRIPRLEVGNQAARKHGAIETEDLSEATAASLKLHKAKFCKHSQVLNPDVFRML